MNIYIHFKNFIYSLCNKTHEKHEANKIVLGGVLLFFALGGVMTWGNLNIYFFSYFMDKDNPGNSTPNNLILSIIAIPLALISVFSIQIAEKVGFKRIILSTSLVYSLSILISCLGLNIYYFSVFYSILPALALGFSMNPVLYTVWSTSPNNKGKISGYMFSIFQLSGLFFSFLGTFIVNPDNRPASIKFTDSNNNEVHFYDDEVSKNVPKMIFIMGLIYFFFGTIGACLLIQKKEVANEKSKIEPQKQTSPIQLEMNTSSSNASTKYEVFIEEKKENPQLSSQENIECPNVKTGVYTRTFFILFVNSALIASYGLYLNINFKTFSLTRLNNDYYVTTLYMFNMIFGGLGRFFWGYMIDKYEFKKIFIILEIMVFINVIIFPFVKNNLLFSFSILSIAFFDGGLISIMGPGLISIYGLNIGAKILPIKGLAFFLGLLICPLIGFLFEKNLGIENVFLILGSLNIIGVILSFFIKTKYNWYTEPK